mmetsp:Transcript_25721/g.30304  ORF Transcript_25721/g.30304 Transcript_25721/m.30304 type:complete len:151 (+) Transcript_25721:276-728(+)
MMQLIKKLRNTTGAPMVECKKAISAEGVDGDYDKATEWLRKNGSAKAASKLAGRDASEGLVGIAIDDEDPTNVVFGAIVRVASETDFASRSPAFSSLVKTVADSAITLSRHRHRSNSGGGGGMGMGAVGATTLLNVKNARSHFERFIPMS